MNPALAQLEAASADIGLQISPGAIQQFDRYIREVLAWGARIGLTAAQTASQIVGLHFVDSLLALAVGEFPHGSRLVDVGSGAGFPGVPIKIVRPDLGLTLVDASRRCVGFLEHLGAVLDLEGIETVWARAETLGRRPAIRETFARSVERATARLGIAAELCLPLLEIGGAAVFLKGPNVQGELHAAGPLIEALGGRIEAFQVRALPTTDRRRAVVVIRKTLPTPHDFPRWGPRLGRRP